MDLRDNFYENESEMKSQGCEPVLSHKGELLKKRINADEYFECGMNDPNSIKLIFEYAAKLALNSLKKEEKKEGVIQIGIYGDKRCGKNDLALKYIFGEYNDGVIPSDDDNFIKIVEANNKILKITINVKKPYNIPEIDGMVFVFDVNDQISLTNARVIFNDMNQLNEKNIPYIFIANFCEKRNEQINKDGIITIQQLSNLVKEFNSPIFEIDSNSENDIDEAFFSLVNKIAKSVVNDHKRNRRKKIKEQKKKIFSYFKNQKEFTNRARTKK